jgi:hypothetical protein
MDAKCRWRSDQLDGAGSFWEPLGQMQIRQDFARILYHIFLSNLMTQVKSINSTQVSFSSLSKSLTMCQKLYELEFSNSKTRILREIRGTSTRDVPTNLPIFKPEKINRFQISMQRE